MFGFSLDYATPIYIRQPKQWGGVNSVFGLFFDGLFSIKLRTKFFKKVMWVYSEQWAKKYLKLLVHDIPDANFKEQPSIDLLSNLSSICINRGGDCLSDGEYVLPDSP